MQTSSSTPATPAPVPTSVKYEKATREVLSKMTMLGFCRFDFRQFCKTHKLSNNFPAALIALGIIERRPHNAGGVRYRWVSIGPANVGERVRQWIAHRTNGHAPKTEQRTAVEGSGRTGSGKRRKRAENGQSGDSRPVKPGVIDKKLAIEEVRTSFFNRLCPQCAETLHQIIDILKS